MEPIRVCLSRQTLVGKCDSWPHRRQVAAGSQDHIALTDRLSSNTSAVPGQWAHDVGFAQVKHLELCCKPGDYRSSSSNSLHALRIDPQGFSLEKWLGPPIPFFVPSC